MRFHVVRHAALHGPRAAAMSSPPIWAPEVCRFTIVGQVDALALNHHCVVFTTVDSQAPKHLLRLPRGEHGFAGAIKHMNCGQRLEHGRAIRFGELCVLQKCASGPKSTIAIVSWVPANHRCLEANPLHCS